jgi:catalase
VLFKNTAASVGSADIDVQKRHLNNCMMADPAYGEGVAKALGISTQEATQ